VTWFIIGLSFWGDKVYLDILGFLAKYINSILIILYIAGKPESERVLKDNFPRTQNALKIINKILWIFGFSYIA